ncbi:hypothetical protein GLOTRDRAFT_127494 [Gloeophyllum trabeum ATCC 11539]|uniref:Protein kinase domain-containing protein n=1 Tax=Gloeophyllum trabeum (strain ATCC 11539 / FP-39264 / Madison 617) TaxID=670483 RepID=S7RV68_GLOTA|nr:uncharacterized protein GLOTRDRAFT_127494 [Gloeophyllum trabeum ATCC 11539]EPQ57119.1 hypothetical protein GLOTRDRAFT_127494 [Gloeophyllum trabeum ATCC 11539]
MSDERPPWTDSERFDPNVLSRNEQYWRDRQKWLQERGYMLRPRFRPEWVPSWKTTNKSPIDCEDSNMLWYSHLMDATRISDGALVGLKRVYKSIHPHEVEISMFLLSDELKSDPRNHTAPIYEVLQVPDDEDAVLIVMPFFRKYDSPRFDTVGEVIACIRQILQGLQFMHEHLVAHRDCNSRNIMLDPRQMYPQSFHPADPDSKRDYNGFAKYYTRTQRPPRYYFIDFGISRRYRPEDMPPSEEIIRGGDKTAPEFNNPSGVANPFPTDVYFIGNMLREDLLRDKYGFDFLSPLVADMVRADPSKRPTIDEVISRFEQSVKQLSSWKLRSRVVDRDEHPVVGLYRSVGHWTRRIRFILTRVPPIPMPA